MTYTARDAFSNFCLDRLDIHPDNIDGLTAEFFDDGVHQGTVIYKGHTEDTITVNLLLVWGSQEEPRTFTRRDRWPGSERFEVVVAFHSMAKKQAEEAERARLEAEAKYFRNDRRADSAVVQAVAESWAARQAAITDDLNTYTPQELAFNGALKRLGVEATREEVRELSATVPVSDGTPCGTVMYLSYTDHDDRGCSLSARHDHSKVAIRLDVPLAISNAQGKALLAQAKRDAKPPLPEASADSLFDDTQPGVPLDLGTVQLTPIPKLEFTELLRRLKALKADLEGLGCTVKLTGPDGKEIQA